MKSVVLAIAAALVLIALPAVAQYTDPSTTTQPATTTEPSTTTPSTTTDTTMTEPSTTTETVPVQEERTNPQVPTHGPSSGLTASGSLVSWNDDEVVLRTATGMTHFKLLPDTTGVTTFTEGQRLTIDFTRNEQGVLIARQIRPEGTASMNPPGITTPGAAAAGAAVAGAASDVAETVDEAVDETVAELTPSTTTTETTTTETTESLPETGSKAPLVGLLGLLALGGAAALRRL